jgi:hypothetical protein
MFMRLTLKKLAMTKPYSAQVAAHCTLAMTKPYSAQATAHCTLAMTKPYSAQAAAHCTLAMTKPYSAQVAAHCMLAMTKPYSAQVAAHYSKFLYDLSSVMPALASANLTCTLSFSVYIAKWSRSQVFPQHHDFNACIIHQSLCHIFQNFTGSELLSAPHLTQHVHIQYAKVKEMKEQPFPPLHRLSLRRII